MTKKLLLWLSRLMPLMMAVFLIATFIQLGMLLHVSLSSVLNTTYHILGYGAPFYLPLTLIFFIISAIGTGYYISAEQLAQQGLRHRDTLFTKIFGHLTNSKMLARMQREYNLNAEEFSATLSARIVGQEKVCEDIAQQLRRRLALRHRTYPVGVFLFTGPTGTGKTLLAKQIAHQTGRPLLQFSMAGHIIKDQNTSEASTETISIENSFLKSLANEIMTHPDAIILLNESDKYSPGFYATLLTAWNDGVLIEASSGRRIKTNQTIFILTTTQDADNLHHNIDPSEQAGLPPNVLARLDRTFCFHPLQEQDLARIATLETERLIRNYGLTVETGGIDPSLFLPIIRQESGTNTMPNAHRLGRIIEDMFSDSLITARQQKHTHVRVLSDTSGNLHLQTSTGSQNRLNRASL